MADNLVGKAHFTFETTGPAGQFCQMKSALKNPIMKSNLNNIYLEVQHLQFQASRTSRGDLAFVLYKGCNGEEGLKLLLK